MTHCKGLFGVAPICAALMLVGGHAAHAERNVAPPNASAPDRGADRRAAEAIWVRHRHETIDALNAGRSPRDWALAVMLDVGLETNGQQQNMRRIAHAAQAAPDDPAVQWAALQQLGNATEAPFAAAAQRALQRLEVLEPDNAEVWLQALNIAARARDAGAVDAALERAAASSRADTHFAELMQALVAVARRYPLPRDYVKLAGGTSLQPDMAALAYTYAMVTVSATALPAYQHLVRACEISRTTGQHAWRARDCAKVGRLLAQRGDTLIANEIGYTLLRVSHTYTGQDVADSRATDWLWRSKPAMAAVTAQADDAGQIIACMQDWIASGSEIASIRNALARDGIALTPPPEWVDENSPFSAKRLRDDARSADRRAVDPF